MDAVGAEERRRKGEDKVLDEHDGRAVSSKGKYGSAW